MRILHHHHNISHFVFANMDSPTIEVVAVYIVGLLGLNLAFRALSHLYKTFLRPGKNLAKLGKWSVVTGATGTCLLHASLETKLFQSDL